MPKTATPEALCCSFCSKAQSDVDRLVAGPGVFICNECIDLCNQIVAEEMSTKGGAPSDPTRGDRGAPPSVEDYWRDLPDEELLSLMVKAHNAHDNVDRAVRRYVTSLRERGVTWARIGEVLDMTRQSAWERFSGEE